jgi:hypothetical protein
MSGIMITPTDQQISEAFKTSNTAYVNAEKKLNPVGEKFATSLLANEQFDKTVVTTLRTTVIAGEPGLKAGLMSAFLAGFEAGKVVEANSLLKTATGATNVGLPSAIGKPRC